MKDEETEISKNNASASAFGWQFQVEAGIFLMLADLRNNLSLNIEGYEQDIEIKRKDGIVIMAQAKSSREYYEPLEKQQKTAYSRKVKGHLKDALTGLHQTLIQHRKKGNEKIKLIYVSNFYKPFGHKSVRCWNECEIRQYQELEPSERLAVQKALGDASVEMADVLWIQTLPFSESENLETAHKHVLRKIKIFLKELGLSDIYAEEYLQKIHLLCNYSTFNASFKCKSSTFVWIAVAFGFDFNEVFFQKTFPDVDEQTTVERIKKKYKSIIQSNISRFQICKDVLAEFENYESHIVSQKEKITKFVEKRYDILNSVISNDIPEEECVALKKYIIYKILTSKFFIDKANSNFIIDED